MAVSFETPPWSTNACTLVSTERTRTRTYTHAHAADCRVCILRYLISRKSSCPRCGIAIEGGQLLDHLLPNNRVQKICDSVFDYFPLVERRMEHLLQTDLNPATCNGTGCGPEEPCELPKSVTTNIASMMRVCSHSVILQLIADPQCPYMLRLPRIRCPYLLVSGDLPIGELERFVRKQLAIGESAADGDCMSGFGALGLHFYLDPNTPLSENQTIEYACRARSLVVGHRGRPVCLTLRAFPASESMGNGPALC